MWWRNHSSVKELFDKYTNHILWIWKDFLCSVVLCVVWCWNAGGDHLTSTIKIITSSLSSVDNPSTSQQNQGQTWDKYKYTIHKYTNTNAKIHKYKCIYINTNRQNIYFKSVEWRLYNTSTSQQDESQTKIT